ncbi:Ig-like domain-containing protein [Terriglobus sp.]|uniref:Ig-like domain-containing protein n=1 Tax=Terriglobus sp. TaxID=1889013 RepID=UPI003B00E2B5
MSHSSSSFRSTKVLQRFCRSSRLLSSMAALAASVLLACGVHAAPPASPNTPAATHSAALRFRAASTIALTVASAASADGSSVTLLATVDGKSGATPGGTVIFTEHGKRIGEAPVANGSASLTVSALPEGLSSLSASYRGDGNFRPSKSATVRFYNDDQN